MNNKATWIKDNSHDWFTPGGDPVWICSCCGGGRHVYGIESPDKIRVCPDCNCEMRYEFEKK